MPEQSGTILDRFRSRYGKDIDLTLRPAYRDLLARLGNPQDNLASVLHVAGTNGKGSTCAFLRAILEAAGFRVHVYTSPHLVRFHERIRVRGELISEAELSEILSECEHLAPPGAVSYFEAATAAALVAFARHRADFTILETGLGGRLDATNIVRQPAATLITRLSYDHREYLGSTISEIAREKAGIMRRGVPCFVADQPNPTALETLNAEAKRQEVPLYSSGIDWTVVPSGIGFRYRDTVHDWQLPLPALVGAHQLINAGLAIACLSAVLPELTCAHVQSGVPRAEWRARLQRLEGAIIDNWVPESWEVWLDGGHNDSAGEVLAAQLERWREADGRSPKPLHIVLGMLQSKSPGEFFSPMARYTDHVWTVAMKDEPLSFSAHDLALATRAVTKARVEVCESVSEAIEKSVKSSSQPSRVLICGSLYLAGSVLRELEN